MSRAKVSTDGSDIDRSPPRQLLPVPSIFRSKGASIRPGGGIEKRLEGPRGVQAEASHAVGSRVDRRTYVMRHGAPGEGARDARPFTPRHDEGSAPLPTFDRRSSGKLSKSSELSTTDSRATARDWFIIGIGFGGRCLHLLVIRPTVGTLALLRLWLVSNFSIDLSHMVGGGPPIPPSAHAGWGVRTYPPLLSRPACRVVKQTNQYLKNKAQCL